MTEHRRRVSEAEKELRDLLPELAKRAGMRKLEYVTFQGTEYCIELPQDANFPASWPKVGSLLFPYLLCVCVCVCLRGK